MPRPRNDGLTPRQLEVARLKVKGYSYSEIAAKLGVKYEAVRNYTTELYRKLDVHSVEQLYSRMLELGIDFV